MSAVGRIARVPTLADEQASGTGVRYRPPFPIRVGFFLEAAFHAPIILPVQQHVQSRLPTLISADLEEMVKFQPHIVVLADHFEAYFRRLLPGTLIVWTRHGFSSKNYLRRSITWCDFACVSSEWVRDDLRGRAMRPMIDYWVTGFPAMDKILTTPRPPNRSRAGGISTLLFAPTWNPGLTAAPLLTAEALANLRAAVPEMRIVIKPHPHIPELYPAVLASWEAAARADPMIGLVADAHADAFPLLADADVLLTDTSSLMFYYLAFDRPIVLIDPPKYWKSEAYDPTGYEWTWRDVGSRAVDAASLVAAVRRAVDAPLERAEQRALYRQRVFGRWDDGHAAERIAERIFALAAPAAEDERWVTSTWVTSSVLGRYLR